MIGRTIKFAGFILSCADVNCKNNLELFVQVNIFEQEVEQIREQSKIKEANFEEEISILKEQVKDRECQTVTENIELIRLQQDKKTKTGQITTLKSQLQGVEETLTKLKVLIIH